MLQPTTFVRRANLSERQPGTFLSVSLEGVTAFPASRREFFKFWAKKEQILRTGRLNACIYPCSFNLPDGNQDLFAAYLPPFLQLSNLNDPIRVDQLKLPVVA
jgi:hypothetical protein